VSQDSRRSSSAIQLTDQQRLDWLRLIRCEGVGPRTFRSLVNHFGGAGAALAALPDLARSRGRGAIRVASVADAEREMETAHRHGVHFLATGEADYPRNLAAIDTAPPLIGVRGRLGILNSSAVSIVGSRNASAGGMQLAQRLARDRAEAGFAIVSGLARGIDTNAHRASLERGTIAVLAGGHDRVYPAENEALLAPMLEQGAIVSEMPMGWEPRGRDFPRRNRLISGLSLGVVIVEAARRSGSLITARFALEQGREVFAVPGSPLDPRAEGTNDLIRQGATLVTSAEDVIQVLRPLLDAGGYGAMSEGVPPIQDDEPLWDDYDFFSEPPAEALRTSGPRPSPGMAASRSASDTDDASDAGSSTGSRADPRDMVTELLGHAPITVDELVRASALGARTVQLVLFELEQAGRLERHGAALVSLRP
jgi:DNA processing protein